MTIFHGARSKQRREMEKLANIEASDENDWLWPPLADAVGAFLRRRDEDASAYERIWRLIHVWESVTITLASL
jgi:hypothetical protein